ncbi:MAG: hypothetical protein GX139_08820 [Armatimonadetes bacterium]|nr:hypothetical protein [Armatimonadota bacterium]
MRFATVVISLICVIAASFVSAAVKLDFGLLESPLESGFIVVSVPTLYAVKTGFGWVGNTRIEARDRGCRHALLRDFIYGRDPADFRIDLKNGNYAVTIHMGDCMVSDHVLTIQAQGKEIHTLRAETAEAIAYTFPIEVKNGYLDLKFSSPIRNWIISGLEVSPTDSPVEPSTAIIKLDAPKGRTIEPVAHQDRLHLVKQPDYSARTYPGEADFMRILERFPMYSERGWHANYLNDPDLGYFGDFSHSEMGLRAMGNYIFVTSLLATSPEYDQRPSGISRDTLMKRARACLAYMTRGHATGDLYCGNGYQWGNDWQSAWWTARMAAGARLLWVHLTSDEKAGVERVVVHEANRHLNRTPPSGVANDTKSEENAWDSEVLAWAIGMFPNHKNAPAWRVKLSEFCMNTLSVARDKEDDSIVDGKPVKDWMVTVNIHDDYTIENHGAYHFCYMSCPLHSLAWGFEGLAGAGITPPEAMFHHYQDVFRWIKRSYVGNSRFAYLSGKDWPRYTYGLNFVLPGLALAQLRFNDADARRMEIDRISTLEREQLINSDGSFYGGRFTRNILSDRMAEYETDTYANIALCYMLHKHASVLNAPNDAQLWQHLTGSWTSPGSELTFARSWNAFASFSWRHLSGKYPLGLFIPAGCADMVEWMSDQFVGRIRATDIDHQKTTTSHKETLTKNGFSTTGEIIYANKSGDPMANKRVSYSFLGDEGIAVVFEHSTAVTDLNLKASYGLNMAIANDVFNGSIRNISVDNAEISLPGAKNLGTLEAAQSGVNAISSTSQKVKSPWLCVDQKLAVALLTGDEFVIYDYSGRNAPSNSLQYDVIVADYKEEREVKAGQTITDIAFVLSGGDSKLAANLRKAAKTERLPDSPEVRYAIITAPSGKRYAVVANMDGVARKLRIPGVSTEFVFSGFATQIRQLP